MFLFHAEQGQGDESGETLSGYMFSKELYYFRHKCSSNSRCFIQISALSPDPMLIHLTWK